MKQGEYWITSPYCYCHEAALFAVNGLYHVAAPKGAALVPISGLSREDTAILAAALLALALFLFLLLFLWCCCCPGLLGLCCGYCCSKKAAGAWQKSKHVDYKLPRAWLDTFKGVPEDQLDAKIRALESSGWEGMRSGGSGGLGTGSTALAAGSSMAAGSGAALAGGAGGAALAAGAGGGSGGGGGGGSGGSGGLGYSYTQSRTSSSRGKGGISGSTGVEDATGDFFFGGESLSREARSTSGQATSSTTVVTTGGGSTAVDAGTIQRMTGDSKMAGLKTVQVVKETNQRTTTKFDRAGNKETSRTTTTTYNTSGGLGSRLMEMIQGITGFGATSGGRHLALKEGYSSSGGGQERLQTGGTVTERFVSNLAQGSQISSNAMQGRQLSVRGTQNRRSMTGGSGMAGGSGIAGGSGMAGGSGLAGSNSSRQMTIRSSYGGSTTKSSSGGGMAANTSTAGSGLAGMSSDGDCGLTGMANTGGRTMMSRMQSSGGGGNTRVTTVTTGRGGAGPGDYLYQREISREYNIHHPDSFLKLYHAYRRYLANQHEESHQTKYSITGM